MDTLEPDLLPISDAEKQFGISQPTIYRYLKAGLLKRYKRPLDKRTYIDTRELKKLLEKGLPFEEK